MKSLLHLSALALFTISGCAGTDTDDPDTGMDSDTDVDSDFDTDVDSDSDTTDTDTDTGVDCTAASAQTFFLIGDSTVSSGSGWGDGLIVHLNELATVSNNAVSGASSKSFYERGQFDSTRAALATGDYVFIQFGHNDSKDDEERYTDPGESPSYDGSFRAQLDVYITEIQAAGAVPILMTSISRMVFGSDGQLVRTHGEYPNAARKLASDRSLVMLDLEEHSYEVFNDIGESEVGTRYAQDDYPADRTHFPPEKAAVVAELVTDLMTTSQSLQECYLAQ